MSTEIVVAGRADLALDAREEQLTRKPQADNTKRAYGRDHAAWKAFCKERGLSKEGSKDGILEMSDVEDAIVKHLSKMYDEDSAYASIALAYAAIRALYRDEGCPLPTFEKVRNVLANIARQKGKAGHPKTPLVAEQLKRLARMYDELADNMTASSVDRTLAIRDAPLLLVGFAAARRRSEEVALDVEDVSFVEDGLIVRVRRSKTDQQGEGFVVGIPLGSSRATCPSRTLRRWLDHTGITEGPIFRGVKRSGQVEPGRLSAQGVARAVKRAAKRLGLPEADFAAHSLRSGLATSAGEAGKNDASIMRQGGWKSVRQMHAYVRPATVFKDNASEGLL
jgi:integrase